LEKFLKSKTSNTSFQIVPLSFQPFLTLANTLKFVIAKWNGEAIFSASEAKKDFHFIGFRFDRPGKTTQSKTKKEHPFPNAPLKYY